MLVHLCAHIRSLARSFCPACVLALFGMSTRLGGGVRQGRAEAVPKVPVPKRGSRRPGPVRTPSTLPDAKKAHVVKSDTPDPRHMDDYRRHLSELFLKNKNSAKEIAISANKATKAGAKGVADLAQCASSSGSKKIKRDLMRKVCRKSDMPAEYWAEIPVRNPETGLNCVAWIPILLVHEVLSFMLESGRQILGEVCKLPTGSG